MSFRSSIDKVNLMHVFQPYKKRFQAARSINAAKANGNQFVLVYQPGKVGSTSIAGALEKYSGLSSWQLHNVYPQMVQKFIDKLSTKKCKPPHCMYHGQVVYTSLVQDSRQPLSIITLVRDPFERNLSSFFEAIQFYYPQWQMLSLDDITHIMQTFTDKFDHEDLFDWFDDEFKPALDLDIYSFNFDASTLTSRFDSPDGRIRVLCLRCDLSDVAKSQLIGQFLSLPKFELVKAKNVGDSKIYQALYSLFKMKYRFNPQLMDYYQKQKYIQHFFTAQEREKMFIKWSEQTKAGTQPLHKSA
jgi:hypothetical protein